MSDSLDIDSEVLLLNISNDDAPLAAHLDFVWSRKVEQAKLMADDGVLSEWPDSPTPPFLTFVRDGREVAAFWCGRLNRDHGLAAAQLIAASVKATSIIFSSDARRSLGGLEPGEGQHEDGEPIMLHPLTKEPIRPGDLHSPELADVTVDCLLSAEVRTDGTCRMVNRDYYVAADGTVTWGELSDINETPDQPSTTGGLVPDVLRNALFKESFVDMLIRTSPAEPDNEDLEEVELFSKMFATAFAARVLPDSSAALMPESEEEVERIAAMAPQVQEMLEIAVGLIPKIRDYYGITDDET